MGSVSMDIPLFYSKRGSVMVMPSLNVLPPVFKKIRGRLIHVVHLPGQLSTGPTVVFIHGIAATGSSWLPLIRCLRKRASQFVIFDLPGHGLSGPADDGFTFEEAYYVTRDLLIREIEPESDTVLVGNSLGGAFAMKFSLEHPDLLSRAILISPAGAPFPWGAHAVLDPFLPHSLSDAQHLLRAIFVSHHFSTRFLAPHIYYTTTRPGFLSFIRSMLEYDSDENSVIRQMIFKPEDLASCHIPVELIWGRQDHVLPVEMREFYDHYLPQSCRRIFPETFGHCPQFEEPEALASMMELRNEA